MQALAETFLNDALASEFFAGGIALGLIGAAIAALRWAYGSATSLVWRRLCYSIEIDNRVPAFKHVSLWLDRSGVLDRARRLRVVQFASDGNYYPDEDAPAHFTPGYGRFWFLRSGALCLISRHMDERSRVESWSGMSGPLETLTLTLLGGRRDLVGEWIAEGARIAAERESIGPALHTLAGGHWESQGEVPRRALATVDCEDGAVDKLRADVERFYRAKGWYAERGVPWRRGYLLYGPPGTGKSSLIRALASELGRDIATIDLGREGMSDTKLCRGMVQAPKRALLVIEDVDAVFVKRAGGKKGSQISFSGLLNAIDGVAAQEGRALFMTTNHRELLDPALIRPGRADLHIELGLAGAAVARSMFLRFFPGEETLADRFAAAFGNERRAPAEIQGWLLAHAEAPETAADARDFIAGERGLLAAE